MRKSRNILKWGYAWYKKRGNTLSSHNLETIENILGQLDAAVRSDNRENADKFAKSLEAFTHTHFKKSKWEYALEIGIALVFALVVATFVRQTWFELYEIPTGSMRPTFKEQDRLTVTKTAFGINIPLTTSHFYFDPELVQRTGVVIWTGENVPGADEDTTYFKIFPYKKRYIKRLMGKPGDTLYFYGGKIYGIDKEGNPLMDYLDTPWMAKLEHIPFMYFEGKLESRRRNEITFNIMNQEIGRVHYTGLGSSAGEIFNGKEWVKDNPLALKKPHNEIVSYSDIWGIGNFAMARLLTEKEVKKYTDTDPSTLGDAVLYLELRHTPRLSLPSPQFRENRYGPVVMMPTSSTVIPLSQKHLDTIMENMYTSRFDIVNGMKTRYNFDGIQIAKAKPLYPNVPNGTYELYYGKGVKIGWQGVPSALPETSPLMSHNPANVKALFNIGTEIHPFYKQNTFEQTFLPHRYAYFRNGDLYVMGGLFMDKNDPALINFVQKEIEKQNSSSDMRPYFAFTDEGAPIKEDGSFDIEKIKTFGLKIPEKEYLVLGDNHAISLDSRFFGFIPQDNLQGAPSLIIWPPEERIGPPSQKPYPTFNIPRSIVWGIVLLILGLWYGYYWKTRHEPVFHKIDFAK